MTAILDCRTKAEAHDTYKRLQHEAVAANGGVWWPRCEELVALDRDMRDWYVRDVVRRDALSWSDMNTEQRRLCPERRAGSPSSGPRVPLHEQLAHPGEDGSITCSGPCGETKPANKFPTARGGIGRLSECRACRDARVAAHKSAPVSPP